MFMYLLRDPALYNRLEAEVDQALAGKEVGQEAIPITSDDRIDTYRHCRKSLSALANFSITTRCEASRFSTPASMRPSACVKDTQSRDLRHLINHFHCIDSSTPLCRAYASGSRRRNLGCWPIHPRWLASEAPPPSLF